MRKYSDLKYRKTTAMKLALALLAVVSAFIYPLAAQDIKYDKTPEIVKSPLPDLTESEDSVISEKLDIADLFKSCPLSPLDILRPEMRETLLTPRPGADTQSVVNNLYSLSFLDTLTEDYIKVRLTDASSITMNLLPKGKDRIVMVIYTISGERRAADSDIAFYTTGWTPLKKEKLWYQPKVSDFLVRGSLSKNDYKELENLIPFPTYELTASENGEVVEGVFTVGKFLSEEAKEKLKDHVVDKRIWKWDGKKYKWKN